MCHRLVITSTLLLACWLSARASLAQVVINEVGASNGSSILDDEGDSPDWVELLNTSDETVSLQGWAISDQADDPGKWRFPRASMEPGERLIVWCSSKDRTVPAEDSIVAPGSQVPFSPTIISVEDDWRYIAAPPEVEGPPSNWADPDFDDSGWETGVSPLGFGEDFIVTEIPEGIGGLFLRRQLMIADKSALSGLIVQARYDDGAVIFLNGVRVLDINYNAEEDPTFQSRARGGAEARSPRRFNLSDHMDLLRDGSNTIGIAVLNLRPTSSDMVAEFELGTVPPTFHTNFRLDSGGEPLILTDSSGEIVDLIDLPEQSRDRSYGRFPDGEGPFSYMLFPSPREPNDSRISDELINSEVVLDPPPGRYGGSQTVAMSVNIPFEGVNIRYTLNGSPPTSASTLYEEPIELRRDTVVRVAAFIENNPITAVSSGTYWGWTAQGRTLQLPVISISMVASEYSSMHNNSGGRGISSERQGYMEIFDADGKPAAGVNMGIRLHGGAGRGGDFNTKKAYKVYFRGRYGDKKLRYPIIPDTDVTVFDKLILRSNFNDAFRTGGAASLVRDQIIRDLHEQMGGVTSHGSWYNLYVNMRYRGVYNIVERMDKDFFASYFPDDGDNWDVIKTGNDVLDGDGRDWAAQRTWFQRSNLSDPVLYEEAWRRIDVENFTSYMLVNIWSQNHDWPHNNWYAARPRRADGRWLFLCWDAEFGLSRSPGGWSSDTLAHVFGRSTFFTDVLRSLLRSPEYQTFFVTKMEEWFANQLESNNVTAELHAHAGTIRPDMPEESSINGGSLNAWENNIRTIESFARGRVGSIRNFILASSVFSFPRASSVSPRVIDLTEPTEVTIRGTRFRDTTTVKFNELEALNVVVESSRTMKATVPLEASLEGRPTITVIDPDTGSSISPNLLTIRLLDPDIDEIVPAFGAPGDLVTIIGDDFFEGARVEFGGIASPSVALVGDDGEQLVAQVPEGEGEVEVRVFNTVPVDIQSRDTLTFSYDANPGERFRRGDSDGNGQLSITDPLRTLRLLFQVDEPACEDAMDSDDSGVVNLTDAVYVLNYLFRDDFPAPVEPFPHCASDPTEDDLVCEIDSLCGQG